MANLRFLRDYEAKASCIANFWQLEEHNIPATSGVYMLVAKPSIRFRYPKGGSSVYYIGRTASLRRRLLGHLKDHIKAKTNNRGICSLYEPRHEYGAKFGGGYCFIESWRGRSARSLEDIVLARFAYRYHAFPVANSAGAWKRIEMEFV